MLSWVLVLGLLPFFTFWTAYGTKIFVAISEGREHCSVSSETYPFMIFWLIISYGLIFCYVCLIFFGFKIS